MEGEVHISGKPVIKNIILAVLAEGGCVSRRAFSLMPFYSQRIITTLKAMADRGEIRLAGHGADKRYTLLKPGKDKLMALNYKRYTESVFLDNNSLLRVPARSMMNGDSVAAFSLAGFSVHPQDKPPLPAFTPDYQNATGRWIELYSNQTIHDYGSDVPDNRCYQKRHTPVNCYYTSLEIKRHLRDKNDNGLRYSRACGVLFTPDCLLRVYHGRDVAFEYRKTGESKLEILLPILFDGYLPKNRSGVLIIGHGFESAEKILAEDFDEARIKRSKTDVRTFVSTRNLGVPLYYSPVLPESLLVLRLLSYPGWADSLADYSIKRFMINYTECSGVFFAVTDDGASFYSGTELNLTKLAKLVWILRDNPGLPVLLACLDWQEKFYETILVRYAGRNASGIRLLTLYNKDIEELNRQLNDYWLGGGHNDS